MYCSAQSVENKSYLCSQDQMKIKSILFIYFDWSGQSFLDIWSQRIVQSSHFWQLSAAIDIETVDRVHVPVCSRSVLVIVPGDEPGVSEHEVCTLQSWYDVLHTNDWFISVGKVSKKKLLEFIE